MKHLLIVVCATLLSFSALAIDMVQVEKELTTTGAVGWIHGSAQNGDIYVITYRNPDDFFDHAEISLVPANEAVRVELQKLQRHDKIRVWGQFTENPSPQKHIVASKFEVISKYNPLYPMDPYEHEGHVPAELVNQTSSLFLVHAIGGEGHILIVEYKDVIIPIFVRNAELTKGLYRNDLIEIKYTIQGYPASPTHLKVNEAADSPLIVKESVAALHGKPGTVEGTLVLYPKSPQISLNVFAVQQKLPGGLERHFTLVNFENPEVFKAITATCQKAWDRHPGAYVNGRNKLVSTKIRVKASGIFNEVDPGQANPQILIDTLKSLEIIED